MSMGLTVEGILMTELPAELKGFKQRELRWLWSQLQRMGLNSVQESSISLSCRSSYLTHLIQATQNPKETIQTILSTKENMLVPQSTVEWINREDTRLLVWLFNQAQVHSLPISYDFPPIDEAFETLILAIDNWMTPIEQKRQLLNTLRGQWSAVRTNDEQTKWLNRSDSDQCIWAWKYLSKNMLTHKALHPITINDRHVAILASLDNMSKMHPAEKTLFIHQMRKAWSQRKYRYSDKAKKQVSIPMNSNTKKKLESIANKQGVSIGDALQKIINNA